MHPKNKILLSGASGFIGTALSPFLEQSGFSVYRLVRSQARDANEISWQPGKALDPGSLPADLHAVINLSGSSIAVPFTAANKQRILQSRLDCTSTLVNAVLAMDQAPAVFINASGVGYYGNRGDDPLSEDSKPGTDFVADVCVQWESAMAGLQTSDTRSIALRTGLVLDPRGGALARMLPAFRVGGGAILGSGRQWMSWISLWDYLRSVFFLLEHDSLQGAVNIVSPQPVTNTEFSRLLAAALHRPLLARAPAWTLKLALGQMAELLLLASQRVLPTQLEAAGFQWENAELQALFTGYFEA